MPLVVHKNSSHLLASPLGSAEHQPIFGCLDSGSALFSTAKQISQPQLHCCCSKQLGKSQQDSKRVMSDETVTA